MVEINVTFVWDKGTESRLSTESSGRSRVNLQDYRNLSSIGFFGIVLVHAISAGQSGTAFFLKKMPEGSQSNFSHSSGKVMLYKTSGIFD